MISRIKTDIYCGSRWLLCLLLIIFNVDSNSFAQEKEVKIPTLNNHIFVPISNICSPFIVTNLEINTGVGSTKGLHFATLKINDEIVLGIEGDIAFIDLGVKYQQRVRDWISLYINYSYSARLGTELQSLLFQGINTFKSFEIGWNLKMFEGEKYMLSANLNLQNHEGNFINILGFINDIIDTVPNSSISKTVPILVGDVGFRFAYGLNNLLGFRIENDISWGETYTREKEAFRFSFSTAVDINFYSRYDFPLGLVFCYKLTSQPELVYVDSKLAHMFLGKIAYTGSSDFSIGLYVGYLKIPLPDLDKSPGVLNLNLSTKFYF